MYGVQRTKVFERSYKRLKASGTFKPQTKKNLDTAINTKAAGKTLPPKFKDHPLQGDYDGYRECHIRGDLLLVYEIDTEARILTLVDIGSHSELFG